MASEMTERFDVLILGGGAAGLMCAIEAGKRGRRAAVLEHSDRCGKKILISGGGRCNFTNLHCRPETFISANPHFAKSALARYTPADFIALVDKHGIRYHEKTLGQLFCDGSSREILRMLEEECAAANVEILVGARVLEVAKEASFMVRTERREFRVAKLVVATGGLSIPKVGATSLGYDLARQFGLRIRQPWPGLVPLLLAARDQEHYCDLAGVSTEVIASCDGTQFREKMLITHRGLSGPAILQISSYWHAGSAVAVDLAPGKDVTAPVRQAGAGRSLKAVQSAFRQVLPNRLADRWLELNAPASLRNQPLAELESRAHRWELHPSGTEGYEKAEVTAGGVDTDELSAKSMESRKVSGLFFIGEVVDVTGHLGGFNFQWAWASGACAGRAV